MTKRILVTGASGFVGRIICAHLPGYEVVRVSSKRVEGDEGWYQADLTNAAQCQHLIQSIKPDMLIHAAWEDTPRNFLGRG